MDLGSGLTFGSRKVNGKVTTGIFFGNKGKASTQRLPIRSTVHPDDDGNDTTLIKEPMTKTSDVRQRNQRPKPKPKVERIKSATSIASDRSNKSATEEKKTTTQKEKKAINRREDGKITKKPKSDENVPLEETNINTKYVTLTQGQLTTILSLVKSQNDIDISGVLGEKKDSVDSDISEKSENVEEAETEGEAVSAQTDEESKENIANLLEKKKSNPKFKPENKTSKQNGLKEKHKTKPEENAMSSNDGKTADSSVSKSSFYLGETILRDGSSSAKKRENQQRWREELEQQRDEQRKRKENERTARLRQEDEELWTKHFDTMLPTKGSPRVSDSATQGITSEFKSSQSDSDIKQQLRISKSSSEIVNQPENSLRNSIDNSEIGDFAATFTNTAVPQRSSYLRTMTSLLDPAQIEALEVKRRKQEEHRKAIEAQVAERKQKKAQEDEHRQQLEAKEDRRLAAERDFFTQRAEIEKARQQMQETMREQKTKELYQQMKNAEESALRDKLARREQILRTKGHDTSRLERAHKMTLEMSQKVDQPPVSHRENNPFPMRKLEIPTESRPKDVRAPFAVTAHTEQGPIKLEISLNHKHNGQLVEFGVQTDSPLANEQRMLRIDSDSDDETEYLKLPQKRKPSEKTTKMQNSAKNFARHYDKYSRNAANAPTRQKRNQPRPKWGVGEKNRTFVPASKRYTLEQQMHDPIVRHQEERLQERRDIAKRRQEESERATLEREKLERQQKRNAREFDKQKDNSKFPTSSKNAVTRRPKSPAVPAVRTRQKELTRHPHNNIITNHRPSSGIHATTDKAKYRLVYLHLRPVVLNLF